MKIALVGAALIGGCMMLAGCAERPQAARAARMISVQNETNTSAAEKNSRAPESESNMNNRNGETQVAKAMFGAGCFWGVEAAFRRVPGVIDTAVGYSGGSVENPTYKQVCSDTTGHAEVVLVMYDPAKTKYGDLLEVFWNNHNPTQVNRQGPDFGSQYRSAIFYFDDAQRAEAERSKQALGDSGKYSKPIATEISAAGTFWKAEDYHQRYLEKRGMESCHIPGG